MARTPLARALGRLLADSVSGRGITRRTFLAGAAVAGVAAAWPGLVQAAVPRGLTRPRIAIVGAGLAGLTCAYRLRQAGCYATVYETDGRVGGRCRTARGHLAEGQVAEHGGELIDQGHTAIRQLARELGLTLDNLLRAEPNGTEPFYWFAGSAYSYGDATRDIKAIWQQLHADVVAAGYPTTYKRSTARGRELDAMSAADWINRYVPGGRESNLGRLLDVAYTIEFGRETQWQSALNMLYLLGYVGQGQLRIFGPSNEKYHVRGGNDLIAGRLADALQGQIELNRRLAAIRQNSGGSFTLTIEDGAAATDVVADHVVLTVPFPVMRATVDYADAGFSTVKQAAIAELGTGLNTKVNLQFTDRHWNQLGSNGETYSDTGYQCTWEVSRAQPGMAGTLVNYLGGQPGLIPPGETPAETAARFLAQAEPVLPGLSAKWNGRVLVDDWAVAPWSRGSYSCWLVGQYTRFAGAEGEREGNCHFAGEHTSYDFQGYLNGAVESGERAAGEILADLKAARSAYR